MCRVAVRPRPAAKLLCNWLLCKSRLAIIVAGVTLGFSTGQSQAQYSGSEAFVTRSIRGRAVLRVDAELEVPPSRSVGIMRVTVSTNTPSKTDRDLVVVFYLKAYGSSEADNFAYRVPVRLEEGKKEVVVEIPHVQHDVQSVWDVGLFEGGHDIEDRRQQKSNNQSYQWIQNTDQQFALGALCGSNEPQGDILKAMKDLTEVLDLNQQKSSGSGYGNSYGTAATTATGARVETLEQASADWRRYVPYSAWTISAAAIQELNQSRPQVADAIRTYISAGGTLLVHSVHEFENMPAIEALLADQAAPAPVNYWSSVKSPTVQWWWLDSDQSDSMVSSRTASSNAADSGDQAELSGRGAAHDAALLAETWLRGGMGNHLQIAQEVSQLIGFEIRVSHSLDEHRYQLMKALSSEKILSRHYMFGTLLITSKPLENLPVELLRQTPFVSNRNTEMISSSLDSNWFWRNLIKAVGKPPVWTFCAIVSLFGALLGPGLLFFTGRIGRRSLMIFLVPAVSLVATGAILLYGVFHEGFDTHVRVTSVQMLGAEGRSGFAWSRQNYFSGLPPREGLDFAVDTYARPVYADDTQRYSSNLDPRDGVDCNVTSLQVQNWRGWLKPRQQQQLLIGHRIQSAALPVSIERVGDDEVWVSNLTDSPLAVVLLRGARDDYYIAEQIPVSEKVLLAAEDRDTVSAKVARAAVTYRPEAPPELNEGGSLLAFGSGSNRFRQVNNYESDDVINVSFKHYMSEKFELPPFGFAVLATASENIQVPLAGISNENLHLIVGVEPW